MKEIEEKYLPKEILQNAIVSGNEYGWKRTDFKNVIKKAVENDLGIIGGKFNLNSLMELVNCIGTNMIRLKNKTEKTGRNIVSGLKKSV